MVKGIAIAFSNYSEEIRKRILTKYDVVEFDSLQVLAQEMATPLLLRLGVPIDCLDYTSNERLFKLGHLKNAGVDDINSPRDLVRICVKLLEHLPFTLVNDLDQSIDFGKPRLILVDSRLIPNFRTSGYITVENRNREVIVCNGSDSFIVLGENPVESVIEVIERGHLLSSKGGGE